MKKILVFASSLVVALAALPAGAAAPNGVNMTLEAMSTTKTLTLPPSADHSPVISLGTAIDPQSGEVVEGYAIVHYKNQVRSSGGGAKNNLCYGFLASGAKWKIVEPWLLNPSNTRGLDTATVFNNFASDITKWEDAADGVVGNSAGVDIFGTGSSTTATLTADSSAPDGLNEIYFGSVSDPNIIAVTTVWGIFSGPTFNRKLVEWDMVFNQNDYNWSLSGEVGKMDFNNIATHESGHGAGLADLYQSGCSEQTMYGYASTGETKKQSLESGDILGISTLY